MKQPSLLSNFFCFIRSGRLVKGYTQRCNIRNSRHSFLMIINEKMCQSYCVNTIYKIHTSSAFNFFKHLLRCCISYASVSAFRKRPLKSSLPLKLNKVILYKSSYYFFLQKRNNN